MKTFTNTCKVDEEGGRCRDSHKSLHVIICLERIPLTKSDQRTKFTEKILTKMSVLIILLIRNTFKKWRSLNMKTRQAVVKSVRKAKGTVVCINCGSSKNFPCMNSRLKTTAASLEKRLVLYDFHGSLWLLGLHVSICLEKYSSEEMRLWSSNRKTINNCFHHYRHKKY